MRNLDYMLKNRSIDYNKLIEYGFIKYKNVFNNQFELYIVFSKQQFTSKLIDLANEEEYVLVDIEDATGEFVGKVREEYENKLQEIFDTITYVDVFKSKQAKEVIKYINEKYNDKLEFLWKKFDNNAIWRNKQNGKWYGLLVKISKSKLGLNSEEIAEIIDLRYQKESISEIVDNKKIYPGYHMNKNSWITVILDGSVKTKELLSLIDNSYNLSIGNKSGWQQSGFEKISME